MAYTDRDRVIAWLDTGHGQKLTTLERIVLVTIAEEVYRNTGLALPGHEMMITRWHMSEKSVKRAIRQLCGLGLLEIAEHGHWGKRSRYRLIGELADPIGGHTDPLQDSSQGVTQSPSGGHTDPLKGVTQTPDPQSHPRSSNGVDDDDDGANAPGSLGGSPGAAPTVAVIKEISAALSYTEEQATEWAEGKLTGRQVSNVPAYLRSCLKKQVADNAKATAARGSAKKSAAKPEPAKARGKPSKKTAAAKPKRKRAGTPCKADGCDTNLVTAEAKWTGYCTPHQSENRQHCETEGCNRPLMDVRAMKAGHCLKHLAADYTQPAAWSESIQTDVLGYIIERRPTLDGWANLLLKADVPVSVKGTAAAEAGCRLFEAIAKGLYWGDKPRVWPNAIDIDIPDGLFDFRADDIRKVVAGSRTGYVQMYARQLSDIVNPAPAAEKPAAATKPKPSLPCARCSRPLTDAEMRPPGIFCSDCRTVLANLRTAS